MGGVIGPLGAGFLVERLGFVLAFDAFAAVAALAAAVFVRGMPETAEHSADLGARQSAPGPS